MSHRKLFFQQFVDDFFHMGAILPSSTALARATVAYLAKKQGPIQVLEAGAGTGAFTKEIIPLLTSGDTFDVVEINPNLMDYLKQRCRDEANLQAQPGVTINFFNDDIRNIPANKRYDYIIFSLPLTNFPPELVEEILNLMVDRLKPNGVFSYVKYIFLGRLKYLISNETVKTKARAYQTVVNTFTAKYQFERRTIFLNVPPTWVYYWRKPVE